MKMRFIGALGSVTGSCILLNHGCCYYLVDCGAVQGSQAARQAGESAFAFKPSGVSAVFLTHAHLDHCGLLPQLVKEGFLGRIYCTRATADLTRHALTDVAELGTCGFSVADVNRLEFACPDEHPRFEFGRFFPIQKDLTCAFIRSSHILGSVGFEFQFSDWSVALPSERRTIVFSGDIGCNTDENPYQALLNGRQYPSTHAEYIVCEATYGGRDRDQKYMDFWSRISALKGLLGQAAKLGVGATVVFPCFTLQRMQELVMDLHYLLDVALTPDERQTWFPSAGSEARLVAEILVDSPLARKYGAVYAKQLVRSRPNGRPFYRNAALQSRIPGTEEEAGALLTTLFCPPGGSKQGRNYSLSYTIDGSRTNAAIRIVIAGAGMCNGGRVTEHLKNLLPSERTIVVLTGYQGAGTPGAELKRRAVNAAAVIDPAFWALSNGQVQARIVDFSDYFSGHADRNGLLDFLMRKNSSHPYRPLKRVFLVHGENDSRAALRRAIVARGGERRGTDRSVARVELPEAVSGWFDLLENEWVYESHSAVDRHDMQVAALLAEVSRLGARVAQLVDDPPRGAVTKGIQVDLAAVEARLAALGKETVIASL
ncbi:MAG: hypothetical protein C5B50_05540 [Verrucomicrobia bacterium]|nr:MAG: hypothetical protein C5B50_05540 [Verrucomicrobiota bacterium]